MLDVNIVRKIVDLMVERDLSEIEMRDGDQQLVVRRSLPQMVAAAVPAAAPVVAAAPGAAPAETKDVDDGLVPIKSPMVGTFYSGPDPESPPFVTIGASVSADSVVCIIEAMKVFNEIKAEVGGTIEKILVQNEQPVEFGQPLYLVRPA